jgi:hypothetical protein
MLITKSRTSLPSSRHTIRTFALTRDIRRNCSRAHGTARRLAIRSIRSRRECSRNGWVDRRRPTRARLSSGRTTSSKAATDAGPGEGLWLGARRRLSQLAREPRHRHCGDSKAYPDRPARHAADARGTRRDYARGQYLVRPSHERRRAGGGGCPAHQARRPRSIADGSPVNSAENRTFVGSFLSQLPTSERGGMLDAAGNLSQAGVRRLQVPTSYCRHDGSCWDHLKRCPEC